MQGAATTPRAEIEYLRKITPSFPPVMKSRPCGDGIVTALWIVEKSLWCWQYGLWKWPEICSLECPGKLYMGPCLTRHSLKRMQGEATVQSVLLVAMHWRNYVLQEFGAEEDAYSIGAEH